MIKIERLSKSFGSFLALREVNLEIHEGQCWMIVGPNGAGKTTLLKIIATLAQPTGGQVVIEKDIPPGPRSKGRIDGESIAAGVPLKVGIDGEDIPPGSPSKGGIDGESIPAGPLLDNWRSMSQGARRSEERIDRLQIRRQIGFIGHQSFLYSNLTAEENLRFYARMYQLRNGSERIEQILQRVGLAGREKDLVRTFSRGMQQRLSIGRALLNDPKIILLDEPFTGLDQSAIENFVALFTSLISPERIIILTTHDLPLGLQLASHFAIIAKGKIVHQGATRSFDSQRFKALYLKLTDEHNQRGVDPIPEPGPAKTMNGDR